MQSTGSNQVSVAQTFSDIRQALADRNLDGATPSRLDTSLILPKAEEESRTIETDAASGRLDLQKIETQLHREPVQLQSQTKQAQRYRQVAGRKQIHVSHDAIRADLPEHLLATERQLIEVAIQRAVIEAVSPLQERLAEQQREAETKEVELLGRISELEEQVRVQAGKDLFDKEAYYMQWKEALEEHSTQLQLKLSAANDELAACLQSQDELTSEQAALRVELASAQVSSVPFPLEAQSSQSIMPAT